MIMGIQCLRLAVPIATARILEITTFGARRCSKVPLDGSQQKHIARAMLKIS